MARRSLGCQRRSLGKRVTEDSDDKSIDLVTEWLRLVLSLALSLGAQAPQAEGLPKGQSKEWG
jgi:hypothetical protein